VRAAASPLTVPWRPYKVGERGRKKERVRGKGGEGKGEGARLTETRSSIALASSSPYIEIIGKDTPRRKEGKIKEGGGERESEKGRKEGEIVTYSSTLLFRRTRFLPFQLAGRRAGGGREKGEKKREGTLVLRKGRKERKGKEGDAGLRTARSSRTAPASQSRSAGFFSLERVSRGAKRERKKREGVLPASRRRKQPEEIPDLIFVNPFSTPTMRSPCRSGKSSPNTPDIEPLARGEEERKSDHPRMGKRIGGRDPRTGSLRNRSLTASIRRLLQQFSRPNSPPTPQARVGRKKGRKRGRRKEKKKCRNFHRHRAGRPPAKLPAARVSRPYLYLSVKAGFSRTFRSGSYYYWAKEGEGRKKKKKKKSIGAETLPTDLYLRSGAHALRGISGKVWEYCEGSGILAALHPKVMRGKGKRKEKRKRKHVELDLGDSWLEPLFSGPRGKFGSSLSLCLHSLPTAEQP